MALPSQEAASQSSLALTYYQKHQIAPFEHEQDISMQYSAMVVKLKVIKFCKSLVHLIILF